MISEKAYITGSLAIKYGGLFVDLQKIYQHEETSMEPVLSALVRKYGVVHPRFAKMDRISKLGYTSVEILLGMHKFANYQEDEVCLILANRSSCLDTDYAYQASTSSIPSPALFVYTVPNIVLAEICIKNKIKGENMFFVSDSFNASEMFMYIQEMLAQSRAKVCIAGWTEVFNDDYESFAVIVEKNCLTDSSEELNIVNLEKRYKNIINGRS